MAGRRWPLWWGIGLGGAIGFLVLAVGGNMAGRYSGLTVARLAPAALSARLAPGYRLVTPDGDGPFPTALLFSGCDGPRDNLQRWAEALTSAGWAALVVDSHGPRGLDDLELWRLVCAGQLLSGAERAGDVAVALADARAMPQVDGDRLALIGASHGGWAVMELLSMADRDRVPPNLTEWPGPAGPLRGVAAVLLLYPYCGALSGANRHGWDRDLPVLLFLAEGDSIADERPCLRLARGAARRGLPVEAHVFEGVTHGFDQQDKAPFSTLGHDPDATRQALSRGTAFLARAIGR